MIAAFLFLATLLSEYPQLVSNNQIALFRDINPPTYVSDTTSFANAFSMSLGADYASSFSSLFDIDYYQFTPTSSGIYVFSAADGEDINVTIYGYSSLTYTALASYATNSTEDNFGYNNAYYLDMSSYSSFYYRIQSAEAVTNKGYLFSVNSLTPKNNGVPEIASYEVSTGFYSLISYSLVSSAISGTQNYNPLGSSQFSFPTNAPGTVAPLQPGNTTIDTTNTYPYCAVGRNELPAPGGGSYISSSYLVGSNLIASAAHVFAENGRIVPNIDDFHIYFGKQGSSYAASASVSKIWFSLSFLYESSNGPYDWAIAKLTSSPGATVGHLGIQKSSSLTLTTNSNLVIDGYYGGLEYQSLSYANFIYDEGNSVIRYTASTAGGDSGAPVCHVGNNRVIGLHTGRAGTSYSCGTLFTDERFSLAYQILGGDIS